MGLLPQEAVNRLHWFMGGLAVGLLIGIAVLLLSN